MGAAFETLLLRPRDFAVCDSRSDDSSSFLLRIPYREYHGGDEGMKGDTSNEERLRPKDTAIRWSLGVLFFDYS